MVDLALTTCLAAANGPNNISVFTMAAATPTSWMDTVAQSTAEMAVSTVNAMMCAWIHHLALSSPTIQ